MSNIIGVTVGTPTSPKKIENEIKPVKTVNGKAPDENGNVEVNGGGSGVGASSWNDLKDKPFDDKVTIEWDGNTTGHKQGYYGENKLYKVSDLTPEPSELIGGTMIIDADGTTIEQTLNADLVVDQRGDGIAIARVATSMIVVAYKDRVWIDYELYFGEKGTYFLKGDTNYVSSLTCACVKTLDQKYLPDDIIRAKYWNGTKYKPFHKEDKEIVVTWEDRKRFNVSSSSTYKKVSNYTPTPDELVGGELFYRRTIWQIPDGGLEDEDVIEILTEDTEYFYKEGEILILIDRAEYFYGQWLTVCYKDNVKYNGTTYPEAGIYFDETYNNGLTKRLTYTSKVDVLDDECLPKDAVGVKSWNDLKDKPFGEETYTGEITIEWDGDPTGKPVVFFDDLAIVKLSDLTPEPSELIGGVAVVGGETHTITEEFIVDAREQGAPAIIVAEGLFVLYEAFATYNITEPGTYVVAGFPTATLTYTGQLTTINKLDPKYLPDGGFGYEAIGSVGSTLTWDGTPSDTVVAIPDMEGMEFHHISDSAPSIEVINGGVASYSFAGSVQTSEITSANCVPVMEGIYWIVAGEFPIIIVTDKSGEIEVEEGFFFNIPKKGVYFLNGKYMGFTLFASSLTVSGYNFLGKVVHKIDKKFLPDDIGGGLPEATEDDNGKGLVVEDGKLVVGEVKDISARQTIETLNKKIPTVTSADNGKFLQVANGAITLVALQDLSKEGQ